MARKGVSYEEFLGAVSQILLEGKVVTQRSVRDRLGTGSMSTIGEHLAKWRQSEKSESVEKPALTERIIQALQDEISIAVMETKVEVQYQNTAISEENAQLLTELKNTEADLAEESAQSMKLREDLAELRGQMEQLQEHCKGLSGQLVEVCLDLQKKQEEYAQLIMVVQQLKTENQNLRDEKDQLLSEKHDLKERVEEVCKENNQLVIDSVNYGHLSKESERMKAELEHLRAEKSQQPQQPQVDLRALTNALKRILVRVGSLDERLSQQEKLSKPALPEVVIDAESVTEVPESQPDLVAAKTVKRPGRKSRVKQVDA